MKIGLVLLVLGALHFFNVFALGRYRRSRLRQIATHPPLAPIGGSRGGMDAAAPAATRARQVRTLRGRAGTDARAAAQSGPRSRAHTGPARAAAGRQPAGPMTVTPAGCPTGPRIPPLTGAVGSGGSPSCSTRTARSAGPPAGGSPSRPQLVPLEFVPAGSADARRRFPGLDHDATLRDLTVVADTGEVYAGDGAWFACLWALADYRATAERLARPHLLPLARQVVAAASAIRERIRDPDHGDAGYGDHDDRADCADDRCG